MGGDRFPVGTPYLCDRLATADNLEEESVQFSALRCVETDVPQIVCFQRDHPRRMQSGPAICRDPDGVALPSGACARAGDESAALQPVEKRGDALGAGQHGACDLGRCHLVVAVEEREDAEVHRVQFELAQPPCEPAADEASRADEVPGEDVVEIRSFAVVTCHALILPADQYRGTLDMQSPVTDGEAHHVRHRIRCPATRRHAVNEEQETSSIPATQRLSLTIFGANGGTGAAAVKQALAAGHRVTAVTRHPEQFAQRHDRLTVFKGDATVIADVVESITGADAVLSALGVPYSRVPISLYSDSARCLVEAMAQTGGRRLVVVTSSAVDPDGFPVTSPVSRIIGKYLIGPVIHSLGRTMYADMLRMEEIVRGSGMDWTILRPPALFDKEAAGPVEVSLAPMAGQFIARQDLAAIMLTEASSTQHHRETLYVRSLDGRPSILRTIWNDGIRKKKK